MPRTIAPLELKTRMASGESLFLLDVRQPDEHAFARIEPSRLIPLAELLQRLDEVPVDMPVIVYCHHGVRSLSGAALLERSGCDVYSLTGGIDAWSEAVDPRVPRY
jgi:rhodanese-related sulfurtransferase